MQIGVDSSRSVENRRIFVVDSNEIDRAVLQFMLQDENETHELPTLDAAFAKAREWKPDLILLGLDVVKASSADVLGHIASALPGAKILIVTQAAGDPLAHACLTSGAHGVLAKPFRVESVRSKVDQMLGRDLSNFVPATLLAPSAGRVN